MPDVAPPDNEEILRQLSALAEKAGIALPNVSRFAATVEVTMPIRQLALELGGIASQQNVFLKGDDVVTVEADTGELRRMTPTRFVGWIEEFCSFKSSARSQRMRDSLSREDATLVLDQDIFRRKLRPLDAVHRMRLPVRREDGRVEFLEPGYDAGSRIFTADSLQYPMDWKLEDARQWLDLHGEHYSWSWPDDERPSVGNNRSWSVVVAGMLGIYCKAMFAPGTVRPMIAGIGNKPGTGKSTLIAMMTMPVFGTASTNKIPKDDEAMNKELDTVAMNQRPYVFFDDIGGGMFSHAMNQFITAGSRTGRALGGNVDFFAMQVCQVFATGNDVKLSADLMRRALVFELFLPTEVRGRRFPFVISPRYLGREDIRHKFLAAMCAIVRSAVATQALAAKHNVQLADAGTLESFEEWSATIGAFTVLAGYANPLTPPELTSGGAEDEDEMRELLVKVASAAADDGEFDRKELVEHARNMGLLESLVGVAGDKDLDSSAMKRWGRQLQRWRGEEMTDEHGRRFRFSKQRQKRGAKYPLTFIKAKGASTPPPKAHE